MEYPTKLEDVIEMVRKEKEEFCRLVDESEELEHEAIGLAKAIDILKLKRDEAIKNLNQCNASIELTSAEVENLEDLQSEIEYSLEGDDPEDDGE